MTTYFLQFPGAILGLVGAVLVASRLARRRRWGFACWVVSNIFLVAVFIRAGMWPLVAMQTVYLGTSVAGWMNNRP